MKKIIAMAVAAVCLVSATFALDFELGARGILGTELTEGTVKGEIKKAKDDQLFDFGAGAYVHLSLFGSLGVQAEANYIKGKVNFKEKDPADPNHPKSSEYDLHTLDLAPMLWFSGFFQGNMERCDKVSLAVSVLGFVNIGTY